MKNFSLRLLFFLPMFFSLEACKDKNIPFDKTGWNESGDGIPCPPLRERMLNDLLENHKLKGLTYRQLIDKLGEPPLCEVCGDKTLSYEVVVRYGMDIDPTYIKTLDFHYNKDSIITDWKTEEFKY